MKRQLLEVLYYLIGSLRLLDAGTNDYVLVLAMARSGSTLLAQILMSNPAIIGIGETKTKITSPHSFTRMVGRIAYTSWRLGMEWKGSGHYFMDKLVINSLLEPKNISLLNSKRYHVLFLIREPRGQIRSYMKVFPKWDEATVARFYIKRARILQAYMEGLQPKGTSVSITYDQLINFTAPTLRMIEDYLGLSYPLSESYNVAPTARNFAYGDESRNIKTGRIVRKKHQDERELQIAEDLLSQAEHEYEVCLRTMEDYCICLGPNECN